MFYKTVISVFVALGAHLLEAVSEWTAVLLFFMALDISTGLLRALITKTVNSTISLKGISMKVGMLILVGMSAGVEYLLTSIGLSTNGTLVIAVTSFFIVNEGISITENSAQLGLPLPSFLIEALEKLDMSEGKEKSIKDILKRKEEKE